MAILKYTGPRLSTGEPERNLNLDGIPAGDVDTDTLTDEQLVIVKASGLYDTKHAAKAKDTDKEP
jgi:hypothetical protein